MVVVAPLEPRVTSPTAIGRRSRTSGTLIGATVEARTGGSRHLRVDVQRGDECLVRLVGELDLATEDVLPRTVQGLLAERACDIVLDLSGLRFGDVRGLRSIVRSSALVSEQGHAMRIVGAPKMVREILHLTGDDQELKLDEIPQGT
jgi:anti-anti-sigma factor